MDGRILKTFPADLRFRMDALVHDLTQALEESSCTSSVRIKVGFRRRTRSTGNLSLNTEKTHSDDSEKLQSRSKELSSFVQSDSDEVSPNSQKCLTPFPLQRRVTDLHFNSQNFESDSVNENFSPLRTGTRRKRKMKRMDIDGIEHSLAPPRSVCVTSVGKNNVSIPGPSGIRSYTAKKKKIIKSPSYMPNRFEPVSGKRKTSVKDRSSDDYNLVKCQFKNESTTEDNKMDVDKDLMSSSSLSSSESDAGICTNDEGREGDDEQSDWFGGVRWDEETDLEQDDPTFQQILSGSLDQISSEARQVYKDRVEWLREGIRCGREIRGGRRRVRDERPAFTVLTSANEKLSRFLQDCEQVTLKLHPMSSEERQQLSHLIKLYSLNMTIETSNNGLSYPIITKTVNTPQAIRIEDVSMTVSDYKKRRKTPQYPNMNCESSTSLHIADTKMKHCENDIKRNRDKITRPYTLGHKSN